MIEARELTKRYGDITAVHTLSFTIAPGTVTGFLGPNGAGKSTTMRMIMGLARWPDTGLVFTSTVGTVIEPRNLSRLFDDLMAAAGVRRIRLHDLRHTCASLLLAQGVPARVVMDVLGHSQMAITMDLYSHVMPTALREAADAIDRALGQGE